MLQRDIVVMMSLRNKKAMPATSFMKSQLLHNYLRFRAEKSITYQKILVHTACVINYCFPIRPIRKWTRRNYIYVLVILLTQYIIYYVCFLFIVP